MVEYLPPVNILSGLSSIGARLKEERTRLGLTQQALGDALGASKWSVINWEKPAKEGGTPIPSDKLEKLSKLGMDVQYIVTGVRSENLLRVAEDAGAWPRSRKDRPAKKEVNEDVLAGVLAGVDDYLAESNKKMSSDKKAELVMLLCEFMTADTAKDKTAVKTAVAKIIQLRKG